MITSHAKEFSELAASVNRIASDLAWARESSQKTSRFIEEIEAVIKRMSSPFDQSVLHDRLTTYLQHVEESHSKLHAGLQRHHEAHLLVSAALPKRGWYLSGQEPCTLSQAGELCAGRGLGAGRSAGFRAFARIQYGCAEGVAGTARRPRLLHQSSAPIHHASSRGTLRRGDLHRRPANRRNRSVLVQR